MFSIIIPTWNNLALLQLCIRSIRQNSAYPHQIIVHVNDGSDGSLEWVRQQGITYTASPQNVGICLAVNEAAMHATQDYILYLNDDMYCCPGWDTALVNKLKQLDTDLFMLSGTMIEPRETNNPCVIVRDYGSDADNFDEARLLAELPQQRKTGLVWSNLAADIGEQALVVQGWRLQQRVLARHEQRQRFFDEAVARRVPHLPWCRRLFGLSLPVQIDRQGEEERWRQTVPAQVGNAPIGV